MPPDVRAVRTFLARVARRLAWMSAARGAAVGRGAAGAIALLGGPRRDAMGPLVATGIAACLAGLLIYVFTSAGRRRRVALVVEQRAPECRNLIVTASELSERAVGGYVPSLVFGQAAQLVARLDPSELFPARNALLAVGAGLALWSLVVARSFLPVPAALGGGATAPASGVPTVDGIDITIEPPTYTGRNAQTVHDPARVEALAGSKITISAHARAAHVAIETLSSRDSLIRKGTAFVGILTADADGYVALQPATAGRAGVRRLVGLTVIPDSPPRVKIVTPGRDQRFPDGRRTLDVEIEADDDIALGALQLRFTKVSGSGERFTFIEGTVPLTIVRRDDQTWTARASWKLDSLKLEPGDMVVYRAIASDRRPGTGGTDRIRIHTSPRFLRRAASPRRASPPTRSRTGTRSVSKWSF